MAKKISLKPENLRVEITQQKSHHNDGMELHVTVYPVGLPVVDRSNEHLYGWVLDVKQTKLAERMQSAIKAGKLFKPFVTIERDYQNKTYYHSDLVVYTHRRLNAALKSIGF
jgi:hypothetical protein